MSARTPPRTSSGCAARSRRAHARAARRGAAARAARRATSGCAALGAMTGGQAVQMVKAGLKAIYLSGWQVAADANLVGQHVSRPEPLPRQLRPGAREADQQRPAARRPDRARRGRRLDPLARADRRRRRGRLRRAAQRVRDHEVVHRGRRGRGPLRGPALVGEEMRPPRRQGARADGQHVRTLVAARLAADVLDVPTLVVARTDALSASLLTSDIDESRPRVLHRRAHARGLLPRPRRDRRRDRARPRLRAVRRPDLVRDLDARHGRGRAVRRRDPRAATPASSSPTTARPPSTGASTSATPRSQPSSATSPPSATASSSSPSPASTPLNLSMFELARGYRDEAMPAYVPPPGARVRARGRRLHRHPPPARGRRRLLRPGARDDHRRHLARRSPSTARPRRSSSRKKGARHDAAVTDP